MANNVSLKSKFVVVGFQIRNRTIVVLAEAAQLPARQVSEVHNLRIISDAKKTYHKRKLLGSRSESFSSNKYIHIYIYIYVYRGIVYDTLLLI